RLNREVHALNCNKTRGYSSEMLPHRTLTSFVIFFWCGTSTVAQLPERSERCLPNLKPGQEVSDVRPLPQTVFVRISRVDFGESGSIPDGLQREIRVRV